jgi:hypothetical protein
MLPSSASVSSVELMLNIFIFYHMHILKYFQNRATKGKLRRIMLQPSKSSLDTADSIKVQAQSELLIGGGTRMFTFEELEPYFTESVQNHKLSFKFKSYGVNSDSEDCHCICIIPMHILLPKLTVAELKIIAAAHKIPVHSRMYATQIQAVLNEHMCEECEDFSTVFEIIDVQQHTRMINLKAVRRYQSKRGTNYKIANQDSVKKHQKKQGEEYMLAHLQSVKKH